MENSIAEGRTAGSAADFCRRTIATRQRYHPSAFRHSLDLPIGLQVTTISPMKSAFKAAVFLLILLAIPLIPFLWLGESFERSLLDALRQPQEPMTVSVWVVGLLASDMFLPVPSSAVVTYAGGELGIVWGTIISWLGLSLGAIGGFGLARWFGEPLVRRFSESEDVTRMSDFAARHGATAVVMTRALPILAEVCIFMLGAGRLCWRQFLIPLLASNALLALTYAACGAYFHDSNAFPVAIVASGAIPLITALVIRRAWKPATQGSLSDNAVTTGEDDAAAGP